MINLDGRVDIVIGRLQAAAPWVGSLPYYTLRRVVRIALERAENANALRGAPRNLGAVLRALDESLRRPKGHVSGEGGPTGWYSFDAQGFVDAPPADAFPRHGLILSGDPMFVDVMHQWWSVAERFAKRLLAGERTRPRFADKAFGAPTYPSRPPHMTGMVDGVPYVSDGTYAIPSAKPIVDDNHPLVEQNIASVATVRGRKLQAFKIVAVAWPGTPHGALAVLANDHAVICVDPLRLFVCAVAVGADSWSDAEYLAEVEYPKAFHGMPLHVGTVFVKRGAAPHAVVMALDAPPDNTTRWTNVLESHAKARQRAEQERAEVEAKAAHKRRLKDDPEFAKTEAYNKLIAKAKHYPERILRVSVNGWSGPDGTIPKGRLWMRESSFYETKSVADMLAAIVDGAVVDARFPRRFLDKLPATLRAKVVFEGAQDAETEEAIQRAERIDYHRTERRKAQDAIQRYAYDDRRKEEAARARFREHDAALKALGTT